VDNQNPQKESSSSANLPQDGYSFEQVQRAKLESFLLLLSGFVIAWLAFAFLENIWPLNTPFGWHLDKTSASTSQQIVGDKMPLIVKTLCTRSGEHEFKDQNNITHLFQGGSQSAFFCVEVDGSPIWKVVESPISEGGVYHFDNQGNYLGFCQLFSKDGDKCKQFQDLTGSCNTKNYCNEL